MDKIEFVVNAKVHSNEYVAVSGNIKQLGEWRVDDCLELVCKDGVWSGHVFCPRETELEYVYFIGIQNKSAHRFINRYECSSHRKLLVTKSTSLQDQFGKISGDEIIDKGWLISQSEIRVVFYCKNEEKPVQIYSDTQNDSNSVYSITCSPNDTVSHYATIIKEFDYVNKECSDDINLPHDHTTVLSYCFQAVSESFSIKFSVYVNQHSVGDVFLCKRMLNQSIGSMCLPVIKDSAIIGHVVINFLVIKPYKHTQLTLEKSGSQTWGFTSQIDAGHRGCGNSFTSKEISDIPENTIAAFNSANHGVAKMVEFDVHLSKDLVPIVYHDLTSAISVTGVNESQSMLKVDVRNLTLTELQGLQMAHRSRITTDRVLQYDATSKRKDFKLFPTLSEVLNNVSNKLAFNIECKWPTLDSLNKWEDGIDHYFDANRFVDEILAVIFNNAGSRKIHFSCFDVDICIMLKRKQNRYPVNLLTNGDTKHYTELMDVRARYNSLAVGTALSEGFLALNTLENDLYKYPDLVEKVHKCGLKLCLYGDNIREPSNHRTLKALGVDVLIYDRIHTVH